MSKRLTKAILFSFLLFGQLHCFNNFFELRQYVQEHEEYPAIDNSNRLNPDYSSFHKKNLTGWFAGSVGKALSFLRLKKPPLWSARQFKDLLEKLASKREQNSYYGGFIHKLTPRLGTKFVLWGDMHGALHSLTRDLFKLKDLGAIGDDFKLSKDHFLLFNGDLILHSPYILETLTLVMRLMEVNPDKVFYLRGSNEEKENWHGHGLQRELEIRARHLSDEKIPLNSFVKKFFMTLPMALYLRSNDKEKPSILRISHFGNEKEALNEENYSGFLHKEDDGKPKLFKLNSRKTAKKEILLRANIKSVDLKKTYKKSKGLQLLSKEGKATDWALLSSPTSTYRIMYEFFNDAFCILEVFSDMEDWTISLYWQDVREMKGFEKTTYNLLSGELISQDQTVLDFTTTVTGKQFLELQKKVEALEKRLKETPKAKKKAAEVKTKKVIAKLDKPLVLGETVDLSKTSAGLGKRLQEGINLRVNKENRSGGLGGGHLVKLVVLDDQYTPNLTLKNVNRFLKDYNTNFIISPLGTPTTEALIPKTKQKEILVLFPYTGASIFRKSNLQNFVHYRTSYANEALALLDYAIKTLQLNKFAFFYQDDSYGKAPLEASRKILKHYGINEWLEVSYLRNELKVEESVKKIKDFNPQAILFYSTFAPSAELIRKIGIENLSQKKLLGISFLTDFFRGFLKRNGLDFIISRVVPNPETSNLEIVREYREEMQKYNPASSFTVDSLEGYINASILFDAVRKIRGSVTTDNVIKEIEEMKNYRFKGLDLNFDFGTRELSKEVWIDIDGADWVARKILPEDEEISLGKKRPLAIQDIEQEQVVDLKPKKNTQKEIIMGCSLWLSAKGGFSTLNKDGQTLAINKFNREGGKDGQRLKLIFLDDKYNPGLARKNINKLLTEYGTNMILSPSGSSTVRSYFDFVKQKKILVMFPTSGADIFRVPEDHIVHFRASYSNETKALLEYALEKTGAESVAIFYQDDAYGRSGLAAMKKILKQRKIKKSLDLPYKRHATAFTEHVKKLKEYAPDFILFFATDKPATALIRQAGASFLAKKILLGPSPLAVESFKTFVRSKGLSFIFSHITPNVKTSNFEIVKEFREEAKKKGVSLDQYTLHGYINASIAIDILKKVKGEVTKEKMIEVINNIKDYDFKGLTLNLDPETRELSKIVWLETGEGEWLKQEVKN